MLGSSPKQEFDREHMGAIPLSQVNGLIQRLMPDINRKEVTHVNLMLSITNSQKVRASRCDCQR